MVTQSPVNREACPAYEQPSPAYSPVDREIGVAGPDERARRGPVAVERVRLRRQMAVRDQCDPHKQSLRQVQEAGP